MYGQFQEHVRQALDTIRSAGTYKRERVITSPQSAHIATSEQPEVLNFCANNYLGLANHPELLQAAHTPLDRWGYGMASVRFICGTQAPHRQLEQALSDFLGTEDTILYSSCFDANGGLFETLLGPRGRRHLRRAQSRLDYRRDPSLQGAALPVPEQRHGRSRRAARRGRAKGARVPADRHGRCLLHGRRYRQPAGHLRPGRAPRRARHGG